MNLEQLETFVMRAIENGFNQEFFKTDDGMRAVQKTIAYRFDRARIARARIDQHVALHWASLMVGKIYQDSPNEEEPGLTEVKNRLQKMLRELEHNSVDFESLIKELSERD